MTASQIARTLAASPCLVYFVKRDGTLRRMLTAPTAEGVTLKGTMCRVFDAEKGEWRTVNAATVTSLRALPATPSAPRRPAPAPDRAPVPPPRPDAATLKAWADDFDNCRR